MAEQDNTTSTPAPAGPAPVDPNRGGAMTEQDNATSAPAPAGPAPVEPGPSALTGVTAATQQAPKASFTYEPTTTSSWVRPGYAAIVVSVVAVVILGVTITALIELSTPTSGDSPVADPNAGTIAAISSAALASLTSLAAAYFGIRIASEQASQANSTAAMALEVASKATANSTANGNPARDDF